MNYNLEEALKKIETTSQWTTESKAEFVASCCSQEEIGSMYSAFRTRHNASATSEAFIDVCFQFVCQDIVASQLRSDKIANDELVDEELSFDEKVYYGIEAISPAWHITIRVHNFNKSTNLATYAMTNGRKIITGSHVYENSKATALRYCKYDILCRALERLGTYKRVIVETDYDFIRDFINKGTVERPQTYGAITTKLKRLLSLCSEVTCKSWITPALFNVALVEYKKAKYKLVPESALLYKRVADRNIREARQYEQAISNW